MQADKLSPHSEELGSLEQEYQTSFSRGLSSEEAARRLKLIGPNIFSKQKQKGIALRFLAQFTSPLIYLLFIAAALIFFVGKASDALVILSVVLINALIGVFQEERAERSLRSLEKLGEIEVRTLRNGQEMKIKTSALVPGDIIHLTAGDAVPADARIIESARLQIVESALTGESLSIGKNAKREKKETLPLERKNMIYTGTHVVLGRCIALVIETGDETELGRIAQFTKVAPVVKTPLEKRISRFSNVLAIAALCIFFVIIGVGLLWGLSLSSILMIGIAQVVSLVPEGLPVAMTIALSVGVQRMAKQGAIIRKLIAVETLGSIDVICTDKTGTLTCGEMVVSDLVIPGEEPIEIEGMGYTPIGDVKQRQKLVDLRDHQGVCALVEAASLCNDAKLVNEGGVWQMMGDPTEGALLTLAYKLGFDPTLLNQEKPRLSEIPFDAEHKMMATIHRDVIFIKGAVEEVLALCGYVSISSQLLVKTKEFQVEIDRLIEQMASQGKRVLGFARIDTQERDVRSFVSLRGRALFLGLVAECDPPREEALQAVELCKKAGIMPIMMTGDHISTAGAIAKKLGIMKEGEEAIDGALLDQLSDEALRHKMAHISVFARLHPLQKLRIIEALQKEGKIVAMTGDGINDAPALARSDVGVAMGITGTDVAKEASKMIITDDRFLTIVKAVEQGRLVYNNIKKVILYLLTMNGALVFSLLSAIIIGLPIPIAAVQILWINVVTEGSITINLILDPLEGTEMDQKRSKEDDALLSKKEGIRCIYLMFTAYALLFSYFVIQHHRGMPLLELQTKSFTLFALMAWFNVFSMRTPHRSAFSFQKKGNPYLLLGFIVSIILQAIVLYMPTMNTLFHTMPLTIREIGELTLFASLVFWIEEVRKKIISYFNGSIK